MTAPICNSNFLYNLFHPKSNKISDETKKKFKNINIILGCTTLGLGHAICGFVYLLQGTCYKASKTQKVAQERLNPNRKEKLPPASSVGTLSQNNAQHFKEEVMHCIEYFQHETSLDKLKSIKVMKIIDGQHQRDTYRVEEDFDGNNFFKFMEEKILNRDSMTSLFGTSHSRISISFMMIAEEEGKEYRLKTHIFFQDGTFAKATGPQVQKYL